MVEIYFSILTPKETTIKIKRSEFIGNVKKVNTEEEAKEFIKEISSKYRNATHNCWAYKVNGNKFNYSDDGEPSGTAGKPIFGIIEKHDLTNIAIVVTRYFGGVKLGVRGLIDAYSQCAEETIINSKIGKYIDLKIYKVKTDYSKHAEIERLLKRLNGWKIVNQEFAADVSFEIAIEEDKENEILKILKNKGHIEYLRTEEVGIK
ncbi:YigZ family protein [Marinitoga aeolica]|uniref:YigZ family protein n=1 Tax=Marinitoga aeolica TaxID=2809031 RepID=A0ABY8PS87_9BACT|nr:YigZ family protein [Marinitoga aeolica]WGS65475.1 YigZ family protein [Marinitoga aeolica]